MANLPDGSGDAYSNLVQGDGSASLTFVMPKTVPLAVGSVVATVDNTAGADTTATLVIRDPSGEVVATKRQGAVIDAGASGTATWALRLDDEGTVGATPFVIGSAEFFDHTASVSSASLTALTWARSSGPVLLDLTTPTAPTFITGGVYSVTVTTLIFVPALGKSGFVALAIAGVAAGTQTFPLGPIGSPSIPAGSVSVTNRYAAGAALGVNSMHDAGVAKNVDLFAYVTKLAA